MDGTVIPNIGRAVQANLNLWDTPAYAEMKWSPDGKSLFYARLDPQESGKYDIMLYGVSTGETRFLFSAPSNSPTETYFYTSSDNQTAAIFLSYSHLYLVSMDGKFLEHLQAPMPAWTSATWSPDSARLAYIADDTSHYFVKVISSMGVELHQFESKWPVSVIKWTQCDAP
jgi:hypothetical protein